MLTWIFSLRLGPRCRHKRFSFPQRSKVDGKDYVTCLNCGMSHEYEIGVGLVDSTKNNGGNK